MSVPNFIFPLGLFESGRLLYSSAEDIMSLHVIFFNHFTAIFVGIHESSLAIGNEGCDCWLVVGFLRYLGFTICSIIGI